MSYAIADEAHPSDRLGNLVYHPTAPLLAAMLCGAWLAWPWFIVNALALGSPSARREITLCIAAVISSIVTALVVFGLVDAGIIESRVTLQIALLSITALKLGIAYRVSAIQSRTFDVYTYYGGTVQKAWYVLTIGIYVRGLVLGVSENPVWRVIASGGQ